MTFLVNLLSYQQLIGNEVAAWFLGMNKIIECMLKFSIINVYYLQQVHHSKRWSHHCPWTNCYIGRDNHFNYFLFTIFEFISEVIPQMDATFHFFFVHFLFIRSRPLFQSYLAIHLLHCSNNICINIDRKFMLPMPHNNLQELDNVGKMKTSNNFIFEWFTIRLFSIWQRSD